MIMGKSRKTVSTERIRENPSKELINKMMAWQFSYMKSPDNELTPEEIDFIKKNMQNSDGDENVPTGHLTRVENAYHFLEQNLKEGDTLDTNSIFRAFSREPKGTNRYMLSNFGRKEPIVIYRTNGNVPHYNITEHTHEFEREYESWIETGKLRIDKITHYTSETNDMKQVMIKNLHLENYPTELENYTDETIKAIGFDPTPQDVIFVDLSYVE